MNPSATQPSSSVEWGATTPPAMGPVIDSTLALLVITHNTNTVVIMPLGLCQGMLNHSVLHFSPGQQLIPPHFICFLSASFLISYR
jgi:hypothetical protein